jgi:hypothetical protein
MAIYYCQTIPVPIKVKQFALQISEPIGSKSSEQNNLPNSVDRKHRTTDKIQAATMLWIRIGILEPPGSGSCQYQVKK